MENNITNKNISDAYLQVFWILDEYYEQTKLDRLGSMLCDLDPKSWPTSKEKPVASGDPSMYSYVWTNAWNEIVGEDKNATPEQVFAVAKVILDYYQDEVKYDLGDSEAFLREALGI
ncbi:MAG: hypothetical protein LBN34_07690 [Clostridiales Family XIII bacterium]|jgi:hypothetical protein|nr:hypothetical protein [Clostridiales Family XIII bacterium]